MSSYLPPSLTTLMTLSPKVSWEDVRKEMVEEKGVAEGVADKVGNYVKLHMLGGMELLDQLNKDPTLTAIKDAKVGLEEMGLLLRYCELYGILDKVSFEWYVIAWFLWLNSS